LNIAVKKLWMCNEINILTGDSVEKFSKCFVHSFLGNGDSHAEIVVVATPVLVWKLIRNAVCEVHESNLWLLVLLQKNG